MAAEQTIDRQPGNRVANDLLVSRFDGVDLQEVSLTRQIEEGLE